MSSSNRRQRQIDAARAERRHARIAAQQAAKARNLRLRQVAIAVGLIAGFVLVWFQPWKPNTTATAAGTPSASASPQITATPSNPVKLPSTSPAPSDGSRYTAMALQTNVGDIQIALDPRAPRTLASMASLSAKKFYANLTCHRLTTAGIFVLQCGDPNGNGTGGPGYVVPDENLPTNANAQGIAVYPRGTVAMANSGANTNGSQFFLVYQDSPLPPNYTVWGKVTSGLDVIDRVAAAGVAGGQGDGRPNQAVVIKSTTVK